MAGETRPAANQAAAARTTANAWRPAARDAVGLGVMRTVPAPFATGMRGRCDPLGPNTSSDKLRRCARCTACGRKGATIQHPGWGGNDVGFLPFPVEKLAAQ